MQCDDDEIINLDKIKKRDKKQRKPREERLQKESLNTTN